MPKEHKTPQWEKKENRAVIFKALLEKPRTFTELKTTIHMSQGTLSAHLKELQKDKIIERVWEKERVYRIAFDNEQEVLNEVKAMSFDMLLAMMAPTLGIEFTDLWKSFTESMAVGIIYFRKREQLDLPHISGREMHIKCYQIIRSVASPQANELMHVDEILDKLQKAPVSDFKEFDDLLTKSVGKKLEDNSNKSKH